jgi:NADH-quinone oxidoreductase subunit J
MSGLEIIFILFGLLTLSSAFMVVTTKNLVHASLWLILALFGVAGIFVLLNAGFLAVVQVIVYIGAIAILMIFAIMLTRDLARGEQGQFNKNLVVAVLMGIVVFAGLSIIILNSGVRDMNYPLMDPRFDTISELGVALVSPNAFIIPFELASILLLAALIGAIVVAWKK